MKIYVAFYKHKRELDSKGKYSHCEVAIQEENDTNYTCYSSSNRDGGVRKKYMELQPERWDLVEIDQSKIKVSDIKSIYNKTVGCKYDFFGACGVILGFGNAKSRYFCSEWCAEALKLKRPHKYSPVSLYRYLLDSNLIKR